MEPLSEPIDDFGRPLEFLQERARTSYSSLARVETKIPLFAGAIAVLGFSLAKDSPPLDLGIALLYLIPLLLLLPGLGVREYSIVPDAETLAAAWPYYPKQTVTALFGATKISVEELATTLGIEAKLLRQATFWLYGLTALIVVVRLGENTCRSLGIVPPSPFAELAGIARPRASGASTPRVVRPKASPRTPSVETDSDHAKKAQ